MSTPQPKSPQTTEGLKAEDRITKTDGILNSLRPYAQSKEPALLLALLFASTAAIPPALLRRNANIPPYFHRAGFSLIFGGAAYVLSTGDARNGSGITTAWSLTYLVLHLRKSLRPPIHPLSVALTGGTATCAALYGTEYFCFQS